jgi:hypothetical protein
MSKQRWVLGVWALAVGFVCTAGFFGCQTGGSGTPRSNVNDNQGTDNINDNGGGGNVNDNTVTPPTGEFATGLTPSPNYASLPRAINPFAASAGASLPSSADLTGSVPPIGNQGQMGSCTAWASGYAAATYSANRQFQWGADTEEHQASPGYLYAKLVEADAAQGTACGTGTLISTAMNLLVQGGCSSLATVGYSDQQCLEPAEGDAANFQIGSFKRVEPTDRNGVKAELAAGNVVVIGANLYDDFMNWNSGGVYQGSGNFMMQGQQHAAHALACVGYDDSLGAYRIMNSWSTQWGDAGFMWMAYETFEATVFEVYAIVGSGDRNPPDPDPGPDPNPDPQPVEDPEGYLDDAFQFADADPLTGAETVYLVFYYHFDAPVLIHTITVTDPNGDQGQQEYETWYADGYVAFTKTGGFQWTAGTYIVDFDTTTEAGNDVTYEGAADVAPLDGGGGGEGICDNFCVFAYDGECDDGGPNSQYDVCDYGTDCADCGSRDENDGGDGGDTELCDDTCQYAFDGECDDEDYCDYGTDCSDCGPRESSAKVQKIKHVFRGIPVEAKPAFRNLPAAGVREGDLGENGKPLVITPAVHP